MFICRMFMYDTLIASGDRTLSFPFVINLRDVWRRVNRALFLQMLGLTVLMNNSCKETIRIICSLSMMHVSTTVQQNTSSAFLHDIYDWFELALFYFW